MGTILSTRANDNGKVIFEVAVDYEEALQLKGHMDNVHIFSQNASSFEANISQRGKKEATKYFLIPRELRTSLTFKEIAQCQKIETKTKVAFIYMIDKFGGLK